MKASYVLGGLAVLFAVSAASAETLTYCDSVSFTSDLEGAKTITLPGFDNNGGLWVLDSVMVDVKHSGSVEPSADNDDPFQTASVQARMIRQVNIYGPAGHVAIGNKTITTSLVALAADDGDLATFDASAPDGVAFGALSYPAQTAIGSGTVATQPYDGVATVDFTVGGAPNTDILMVNDLQFDGPAPDSWQLEVENPLLTVEVCVTYDYTIIPEPTSLALLALGGLLIRRR